MSNTELLEYKVSLYEDPNDEPNNEFIIFFKCMAENEDHASEQAKDMYPGCKITHIHQLIKEYPVLSEIDSCRFKGKCRGRSCVLNIYGGSEDPYLDWDLKEDGKILFYCAGPGEVGESWN